MTIDWFVIMTPVAVAVICLLFAFVGCPKFDEDAKNTVLQLNPSPNLQDIAMGLPNKPVTKIEVSWDLTQNMTPMTTTLTRGGSIVNPMGGPIVPTDMTATFKEELDDSTVGSRDRVRCTCTVTVTAGGMDQKINVAPVDATLAKNGMNTFLLQPLKPAKPNNPTRRFQCIYDAGSK